MRWPGKSWPSRPWVIVLQAFSVSGLPSPDELKALVTADLKQLLALQNSDGGFPYWEKGEKSDPFDSVQVVQSFLIAHKYGYGGSTKGALAAAVKQALPYLDSIDNRLPDGTTPQTRDSMNAYALAVRFLAGDKAAVTEADQRVDSRGAALPLDAVAWLLPVVSAAPRQTLLTRVNNAAVDDAGSVTFTDHVVDDAWTTLQSDTRTDALILGALLSVDPKSDLPAKVVHGLMDAQRGGRWDNLQENAFALMALRQYFDVDESDTPDFVAATWLGHQFAGQHRYSGRTTGQTQLDIPTSTVLAQGNTSVTLSDKGSGRLYYRIGLTTAPANLSVPALDRGFVVSRTYQGADQASDVIRDAKGVWHIKAGARVRVTVTMVSRSAQSHVALTDPLPAGLEALNPALATTSQDLAGKNANSAATDPLSWNPTWYDHQDLRDDRAEAFADLAAGRRLHLQLSGQRDHSGLLRRTAGDGQTDLRARDVRPNRHRPSGGHRLSALAPAELPGSFTCCSAGNPSRGSGVEAGRTTSIKVTYYEITGTGGVLAEFESFTLPRPRLY